MATQAHITSVEALESFRSSLIIFSNKSHSVVDQMADEIRRTRGWVQVDQRRYWEGEVRRRQRMLAQAEQELLSARMVKLLDNLAAQQAAVRKWREALAEAENKVRQVKRWVRDFDAAVDPLMKSLDGFRSVLGHDLPHAIHFLTQAQTTLAAYREARLEAPTAPEEAAATPPL